MRPLLAFALASIVCGCTLSQMAGKNLAVLASTPAPVPHKIVHPVRADARLAVLWVGHATALLQMDDRFVLTDPVLTETVGQLSRRRIEPGLDPENVPPLDAVLISHMHFDHLSMGSLEMLEHRIRRLYVPEGGLVYIPDFDFDAIDVSTWQTYDDRGMYITAVPNRHEGWRYGVDRDWMTKASSAWVIEYHGLTVYFGGDTGFEAGYFEAAASRFPSIDLALLPIAPIHPRAFMEHSHEDPDEAVRAFLLLRARHMVPIHFETFVNSLDVPGEAKATLERAMSDHGLDGARVHILDVGEQRVIVPRGD